MAKKYKECDELNADLLVLQLALENMPTAAAGTDEEPFQLETALLLPYIHLFRLTPFNLFKIPFTST